MKSKGQFPYSLSLTSSLRTCFPFPKRAESEILGQLGLAMQLLQSLRVRWAKLLHRHNDDERLNDPHHAGIYGVSTDLVMSRTRELGIRLALGAESANVFKLVLPRGMSPAVFGRLAGVALSLLATPPMSSSLLGVRPFDLPTLAAAAMFLSTVAFAACYVPARRAMCVDPMIVRRYE